ncbi:E3 ubiquitin ligase family protein [Streptomyces sp. XM4193]|uniref:E3 ubiquitin ligase family protein n=1 Tax=Streptomyces sp. XM4193 TaxID=2929782 RepID=UPI001FF96EA0|nr:E3 ubiquitin ligase family protein [Streptomyces sp. XM4193]MCK1797505.1 E3 ubiquitin ligase family protein [Streptomyces sp. XM4193]
MAMILIGLAALAFGALVAFKVRGTNERINRLERTETVTISDLRAMQQAAAEAAGPGHFRYPCEVVGVARAHRDGLITSQLKEIRCVWHRHKITRKYEEFRRDSKGRRQKETRHEVVSQHRSGTAFFVEDASGKVVVRPSGADVVGAAKPLNNFVQQQGDRGGVSVGPLTFGGHGGTVGFKHEEWVLREGVQLFVHGEASDVNGYLEIGKPAESGEYIVSAKSERELLKDETRELMIGGTMAGVILLGGAVLLVLGIVL